MNKMSNTIFNSMANKKIRGHRTYDSQATAQARLCVGGFCNKEEKKMQIYGAACTRKQVAENTKETRTNRAAEFCCCGVCTDDVPEG